MCCCMMAFSIARLCSPNLSLLCQFAFAAQLYPINEIRRTAGVFVHWKINVMFNLIVFLSCVLHLLGCA